MTKERSAGRYRSTGVWQWILISGGPIVAAIAVSMVVLWLLNRNPFEFYANVLRSGLFSSFGLQESINRAGPLLVISAGLVVAFRANIWHLGIDGCFILGAVVVAGVGPLIRTHLPNPVLLLALAGIGALVGAAWSAVPAYLKANYDVNEIVTTLIMTSMGLHLAHFLVKAVFQDPTSLAAAQTRVLPVDERLPTVLGTRIHIGIFIGLAVILLTHYVVTRTPVGIRLQMMGANLRAAMHFGFHTHRLTYVAFYFAGAAFGLAGALSIIGEWGVVGEGWNPAWGFLVVPLVFLARKSALASVGFVLAYSVVSIGGELATRRADLPNHFQLILVGLILLFMTMSEWLQNKRERETAHPRSGRRNPPDESATGVVYG